MAFHWSRCASFVAAGITVISLTACGSSTVESALEPSRIISFGDGHSDIGQTGSRYSINGVTDILNWTEQIASDYGRTITPAVQGGWGYAQGNTRVVVQPDAANNSSTPTLAGQVSNFLAASQFSADDLVLLSSGTSDIIALGSAALNGSISRDEAVQASRDAAEALTGQVQRMINAGAEHIVIVGAYDLGESIWARSIDEQAFLSDLSKKFNEAFKISMQEEGYGNNALYIDFEYYINNMANAPGWFGLTNIDVPICNSIDSGNGIGIGTNQVNSALCNTNTLVDSSYDRYGFVDYVYLSPTMHRDFGRWAYNRIRERW